MRKIPRWMAAPAVAVLTLGTGAAALAATGVTAKTGTRPTFECVKVNAPRRHYLEVRGVLPHACNRGFVLLGIGAAGATGARGATGPQGPAGPAGPPGPAVMSVTAATAVSARSDSSSNGTWATDAFTRTVTVTRRGAVSVSHCGAGAVVCYFYTGSIADNGSFATVAGALAPNQHSAKDPAPGGKIQGTVTGTMTGGSAMEFYVGSSSANWNGAPSAAGVPATVTGNSPSTGTWYEQFFTGTGDVFNGAANLVNWSWAYSAPATCEHWTDAAANGGGNSAGDGNIAGVNMCG